MVCVDDLGEGFVLSVQVPDAIGALRICDFMQTALLNLVSALEHAPSTPIWAIEVVPSE